MSGWYHLILSNVYWQRLVHSGTWSGFIAALVLVRIHFVPVSRSRPLSLLWRPYIKNLNYATANIAMDVGFVPMTLVLAGQTFGVGTGFSQPAPARCSRERHIWDNVSLDESSMIETAVFTRGCMSTGVGTSRSRFELRKCDSMSCQRVPFWAPSVRTAGRET